VSKRLGILQRKCACGQHTAGGGECEECRKKRLQRKAVGPARSDEAPEIVHEVLRSPGQPLDPAARQLLEPRFGHDFSQVRVHADERSAASAQAVDALAYTVGTDVVFGRNQYRPGSPRGVEILAHELTHVVQQRGMERSPPVQGLEMSRPGDVHEQEADRVAALVVHEDRAGARSAPASLASPGRSPVLQRLSETATGIIAGGAGSLLPGAGIGLLASAGAAGFGVLGALIGVGVGMLIGGLIGHALTPAEEKPEELSHLADKDFRKRWEAALEEGLGTLHRSVAEKKGCRFTNGRPIETWRYDEENWTAITELNKYIRAYVPKKSPYEGVELLFQHLDRWDCDCALFPEMALLYAWHRAFGQMKGGREKFNEKFKGLRLRVHETTGLEGETHNLENYILLEGKTEKQFDKAWDDAPVGTKVTWQNQSPNARQPWEFENGTKRSKGAAGAEDRYSAHPLGENLKEEEVVRLLAKSAADATREDESEIQKKIRRFEFKVPK
jgi:hypothetical protein